MSNTKIPAPEEWAALVSIKASRRAAGDNANFCQVCGWATEWDFRNRKSVHSNHVWLDADHSARNAPRNPEV